jgi:hypothetical protein
MCITDRIRYELRLLFYFISRKRKGPLHFIALHRKSLLQASLGGESYKYQVINECPMLLAGSPGALLHLLAPTVWPPP